MAAYDWSHARIMEVVMGSDTEAALLARYKKLCDLVDVNRPGFVGGSNS